MKQDWQEDAFFEMQLMNEHDQDGLTFCPVHGIVSAIGMDEDCDVCLWEHKQELQERN